MEDKAHHILDQAGKLYHRYGVKSVTMDDVAKHLGISKKTLYEYFRDKKDLVAQVLKDEFDHYCSFFDHIDKLNLNAIEQFFEVYKVINRSIKDYNPSMTYDIRKYYPDLYFRLRSEKRKKIFESSLNNLKKGIREGLFRPELNAEIIAKLHLFRIENLFDFEYFTPEDLSSFEVFHELFVYHLQGIMNVRGRKFFEDNFNRFRKRID